MMYMPSPQWRAAADRAAAAVEGTTHWPEPITHRLPSAIDADRNDQVQVLFSGGWELCHWSDVVEGGQGWQHSPRWELRVEANETGVDLLNRLVLAIGCRQPITSEMRELVDGIREALKGEG